MTDSGGRHHLLQAVLRPDHREGRQAGQTHVHPGASRRERDLGHGEAWMRHMILECGPVPSPQPRARDITTRNHYRQSWWREKNV